MLIYPWDRITTAKAVYQLLVDGRADQVKVTTESGFQKLEQASDWWKIVMGSGLRWSVEQMNSKEAQLVRESNLQWIQHNHVDKVQTNVIYAIAEKPL